MSDPYNTPEFHRYAKNVRENLIPMLQESSCSVSLVGEGEPDIKFAIELGMSILLDKPIIAVVQPGTKVQERLIRVADRILEYDVKAPGGIEKVGVAIQAAMKELADEGIIG